MENFIEMVGRNTAIGIIELMYETIITEIRKSSQYGTQWFAPPLYIYEEYKEDDMEEWFGKVYDIQNGNAIIPKPTSDDGDVIYVVMNTNSNINFIFHIDGSVQDWEINMKGVASIINYGIHKIKREVKKKLKDIFNGLVEDKWLINIKGINIGMDNKDNYPLLITIESTIINENEVRPEGKLYSEIKHTTKIGKLYISQ